MTSSGPFGDVVDWCNALAEGFEELLPLLRHLGTDISHSWRDDRGQAWAERVGQLHRELGRNAADAAELGRMVARLAEQLADPGSRPASRNGGPRLGDTEGMRVDDERGMRIAQLPAPDTEPG